jgi:hypothetical protein
MGSREFVTAAVAVMTDVITGKCWNSASLRAHGECVWCVTVKDPPGLSIEREVWAVIHLQKGVQKPNGRSPFAVFDFKKRGTTRRTGGRQPEDQ